MTDEIDRILKESVTVAVVGMSPRPDRPSHYVAKYLLDNGYDVIPVNPLVDEVSGLRSYPELRSIPKHVDLVDIFRRSNQVPPIVDEAIEIGSQFIWMQDGVVHEEAAAKARAAGVAVVMDNCTLREHSRRFGDSRST